MRTQSSPVGLWTWSGCRPLSCLPLRASPPLALGSALLHQALERQELGDSEKEDPPASSSRAGPDFIGRVGWPLPHPVCWF